MAVFLEMFQVLLLEPASCCSIFQMTLDFILLAKLLVVSPSLSPDFLPQYKKRKDASPASEVSGSGLKTEPMGRNEILK